MDSLGDNTYLPSLKTLDLNSVTTRCVIAEGEALGPQLSGAVLIAKRFQLRKCGHHKDAVPAAECIKSMIGKSVSFHSWLVVLFLRWAEGGKTARFGCPPPPPPTTTSLFTLGSAYSTSASGAEH